MKPDNQAVWIVAILAITLIALALIAATVYAPNSGSKDLLALMGAIVTAIAALAKLQSVSNEVKDVGRRVDDVHEKVNGINQAALLNQAIVSKAEGKAEEKADVAAAKLPPVIDEPNPRYQPPARPNE